MQALQRLLGVVEHVASVPGGATPTEVAAQVGLSLSTVSRLLHDLSAAEVVTRDSASGRYRLGLRLLRIIRSASDSNESRRAARAVMASLRDLSGETVSLHMRVGHQRICIDLVQSRHAVARVVPLGVALPLLGSATGDVLLASAPVDEAADILKGAELDADERDRLALRLERVRERGWSAISDTWALGVTGISGRVRDIGGIEAALSISGPTARFGSARSLELVPPLVEAARELADAVVLEAAGLAGWIS